MTINEKIAAAIAAAADAQAENERQDARARNAQRDAQREGLREVLGSLYDELGVTVDSAASGRFEFADLRFEVEYSAARASQFSRNGSIINPAAAAASKCKPLDEHSWKRTIMIRHCRQELPPRVSSVSRMFT